VPGRFFASQTSSGSSRRLAGTRGGTSPPIQLAYHGIRLITFLIGQPQVLAQKAGFQMSGDEQIVARFMIEQLLFHGIRDAAEAATCLAGYDKTRYPEGSGPSFSS
jgi:hypothetical protein